MKILNPQKSFKGGVPVPHTKRTKDCEVIKMPVPGKVIIPMIQHIGAPCSPLVAKGDEVKVGQKIGDSEAPISSPVHSSVSGKVLDVRPILYAGGVEVVSVEIETDGQQTVSEDIKPPDTSNKEELIRAIRDSGLVGLGGAGFPTFVKLTPPKDSPVDTLIINGAECEPFITADYREMMENAQGIIDGTKIIMQVTGIEKAYIGVESNKPEALKKFALLLKDDPEISVVKLRTRYPQGGEKQLIYAVTGRMVPSGKLPSDVGVLVQNVTTASFLAEFVKTGMPLIKKRLTVDGTAVKEPKNVEVLIGTPLKDVFEFCGGFSLEPSKIIMGGPMMGVSQFSLNNTVVKHTNALLAFTIKEAHKEEESTCLKCGKCVDACPMNLSPFYINACVMNKTIEETPIYNVNDCIECGCCSFVCPASRHLVQSIRYAKAELRRLAQAQRAKA